MLQAVAAGRRDVRALGGWAGQAVAAGQHVGLDVGPDALGERVDQERVDVEPVGDLEPVEPLGGRRRPQRDVEVVGRVDAVGQERDRDDQERRGPVVGQVGDGVAQAGAQAGARAQGVQERDGPGPAVDARRQHGADGRPDVAAVRVVEPREVAARGPVRGEQQLDVGPRLAREPLEPLVDPLVDRGDELGVRGVLGDERGRDLDRPVRLPVGQGRARRRDREVGLEREQDHLGHAVVGHPLPGRGHRRVAVAHGDVGPERGPGDAREPVVEPSLERRGLLRDVAPERAGPADHLERAPERPAQPPGVVAGGLAAERAWGSELDLDGVEQPALQERDHLVRGQRPAQLHHHHADHVARRHPDRALAERRAGQDGAVGAGGAEELERGHRGGAGGSPGGFPQDARPIN